MASGFATGTTGGANLPAAVVQNCEQLIQKLGCGRSDPGKFSYRIPVGTQTCTELGSDGNRPVERTRNERRLAVKSNKTILGLNGRAKIQGASLDMSGSSTIILRNFSLEDINPGLVEAGDDITLANSQRIWIDHLRFSLISDGYVDIKNSALE